MKKIKLDFEPSLIFYLIAFVLFIIELVKPPEFDIPLFYFILLIVLSWAFRKLGH